MRLLLCPLVMACLWFPVGSGHAQALTQPPAGGAEADALDLADKAPETPAPAPRALRAFVELAAGRGHAGDPAAPEMASTGRLALDVRYAGKLAPPLDVVLSTRLDLVRGRGSLFDGTINTLREAYLGWSDGPAVTIEAGRINLRQGVAMGFNPTDWFKESAVRPVLNLDPAVLRENRQGTVALQGQRRWDGGALTMVWSPEISGGSERGVLALRPNATNPRDRWLLVGSYTLAPGLSPQLLLHGGAASPTQLGVNLTRLLTDSVVAYAEFAGGRDLSLVQRAQSLDGPNAWQKRLSAGLTYTTPFDLTLTAEAQHNSAAPQSREWRALPVALRGRLLDDATSRQDLPARNQLFFHALWKVPVFRPLELQGFYQRDFETHSQASWVEARFRMPNSDIALQIQAFGGADGSIYGSVPQPRSWQLIWRHYL